MILVRRKALAILTFMLCGEGYKFKYFIYNFKVFVIHEIVTLRYLFT